jgi:hypothetical protein
MRSEQDATLINWTNQISKEAAAAAAAAAAAVAAGLREEIEVIGSGEKE